MCLAFELPHPLHPVLHADVQETGWQEARCERQGERCCERVGFISVLLKDMY